MPDEVKHTPGPWFVGGGGLIRSMPAEEGGYADHVCAMPYSSRSEAAEMPRSVADAALIAAASDLLALCKEADVLLMPYISADVFDGHAADFFRRLSAAIKKAEGAA